MAYRYRSSITSRPKLFYQQHGQLLGPSFSYVHRDDTDRDESPRNYFSKEYCFGRSLFGTKKYSVPSQGARSLFEDCRRIPSLVGYGQVFHRNFSSASVGEGVPDKIAILNNVVNVLGDNAEVTPAVSEVAAVAADSYFPVAALQYLIDYVHVTAGLDWWAAIAATTIFIRLIQLPVMIHQLKVTSKLTLLRPEMEKLQEEMQNSDLTTLERHAKVKALYNEHGVNPFTPLKGILISGPIFCSFFFAVRKMAEGVPSFNGGGTLWFSDLTTPDSLYILPVLTALTFWITVELNSQEGMEGNPNASAVKWVSRVFAVLTVPLTLTFPKAIFCYWVPTNLFSLAYGLVIKRPAVKKFLGVPIIAVAPPSANGKPAISFFEALKKYAAQKQLESIVGGSSSSEPIRSVAAAAAAGGDKRAGEEGGGSVLSHRLKSLEKEVKSRKKNKKSKL